MWEYEIMDKETGNRVILFGHSLDDACEKHGIDRNSIILLCSNYAD